LGCVSRETMGAIGLMFHVKQCCLRAKITARRQGGACRGRLPLFLLMREAQKKKLTKRKAPKKTARGSAPLTNPRRLLKKAGENFLLPPRRLCGLAAKKVRRGYALRVTRISTVPSISVISHAASRPCCLKSSTFRCIVLINCLVLRSFVLETL